MTADDLRDELHFLVDDENLSETQELSLINQAYDRITAMRPWNFMLTEDTSKTITSGTTSYALQSTFLYGYDDAVLAYDSSAGEVKARFKVVQFKDRMRYNNVSGYVYFDIKNNTINFCSTSDTATYAGYTLFMTYYAQPAQLTASDSPVFNRAFHRLLALEAARYFWYNDQQVDGAFDGKMAREYDDLLTGLILWDDNLATSIGDSLMPPTSWIPEVS